MEQQTFGDWCALRCRQLEHLACGVPEEYEANITKHAEEFFLLAYAWGEPWVVAHLDAVRDPALNQREFWELSSGWFG